MEEDTDNTEHANLTTSSHFGVSGRYARLSITNLPSYFSSVLALLSVLTSSIAPRGSTHLPISCLTTDSSHNALPAPKNMKMIPTAPGLSVGISVNLLHITA